MNCELELGKVDLIKDTAAILFSSGTTGYPKAIPYNHIMLWNYAKSLKSMEM